MSDVQITVDLPYPAEVVWRALTERRLMSEWFLPTDLAPVAGGVYRVFPPPGLAGFGAPFDVDVLEVVEPKRLLQRWRGEQLHTEMLWEIAPTPSGTRLRVVQSGFLGLHGDRRRAELLEAYEVLFQERLPALLARLALDDVPPPPPVRVPLKISSPPPRKLPWWRISMNTRMRLLSVTGAVIITALLATALATLVLRPPSAPADTMRDRTPDLIQQPGSGSSSASPAPASPAASPSVVIGQSQPPAPPKPSFSAAPVALSANYHTAESYDRSFIGSITIIAGPQAIDGWQAMIELPPGAMVTSAWDQIDHQSTGQRVVFSSTVHRKIDAGKSFTFSFQVGDGADGDRAPLSCTVNGVRCSGF